MRIILGAALVVLIALLGSRTTFTKLRLPLAARHIYLTGTEYIIVGLCLGSQMLGFLDAQALKGLDPLFYLATGWIGLMFGIQLEISQIARFPKQYILFAVLQALVTMLICFIPLLYLIELVSDSSSNLVIGGAIALSAIAVPTAQSSLALIQKDLKLRRSRLMEILSYVAGIDALVGVGIFGFLFCYTHTTSILGFQSLVSGQYLVISVGLGAVMGGLLHILTRLRCNQEDLLLYTVGIVVFSAGAAAFLRISPLFVTVVAGFIIANLRGAKVRILRVLISLEKPFYIIILVLGGAMLSPGKEWPILLGLAAVYIALRMVGKAMGGYVSSRVLRVPAGLPSSVGLALISQGGMAAAMVVSYHHAFPNDMAGSILMVVLVAIIVNELIGPFLASNVIKRAS
ncbi:MAG: hypothetical protein GY847_03200 [Proteobacteria bacterium]|nr:hypothetical protein [Pseudomonadota bacterium]